MTSTRTRAETVAVDLRQAILNGRYLPGERLVEMTLAASMDVSQNTIRDALRILEQGGWVLKQARHGVHVRSFTLEEAEEVYALLGAIGDVVIKAALKNISRSGIARLGWLLDHARRAVRMRDPQAATEDLFMFHETLVEIAAQPLTAELLTRLYNHARLLEVLRQSRAPRAVDELDTQIDTHERLLKLIGARDEAAYAAMHDYINAYRASLMPVLKE